MGGLGAGWHRATLAGAFLGVTPGAIGKILIAQATAGRGSGSRWQARHLESRASRAARSDARPDPKRMPAAPFRIDLKSAQLGTLQMALRTRDLAAWRASLQEAWGDVGAAFDGEALCLDLRELPPGPALDWPAVVAALRHWQLCPVAVTGASALSDGERAAVRAAGLAWAEDLVPAAAAPSPTPAPAAPAPAPEPAQGAATLVIDRPLRSGQQVYARDADLIVLGLVSHGAEVIADGHIHVYGALRGRAIAGAKGRTDARIFAHSLEAELLAVAGTFRTSEKPLPADVLAKPAQVRLDGERLVFEPLKF